MSKETFAQTSLLCVSYPVRSCVSLTCLRLEDMKTGILLCHMLGLCYVLMPAPAKYPERSWRLPLLGEDRHGAEQRKGDPQRCPDKKKRLGKMGWCLSLAGLSHSAQCPRLHSGHCKQMVGFPFKGRIIFRHATAVSHSVFRWLVFFFLTILTSITMFMRG